MSRFIKLAAAAITLALTATITAIVADNGRAAPPQRSVRYDLSLDSKPPVVTRTVRVATVQAQQARYRLNLAGNTVIAVGPSPTCQYPTWQASTTRGDGR